MERKLLVSHLDLDGHACIAIARFFNEKLKFTSMMSEDYNFEEDEEKWNYMKTFNTIIFSDLSIPKEKTEELRSFDIHVEIYDHHSKADWLEEDRDSSFDLNRCGTKIFWQDYVIPRVKRYLPIIDEFVELVDTYDLWKDESDLWEKAKNLNSVLMGMKDWKAENSLDATIPFYDFFERKIRNFPHWVETRQELEIIERSNKREEDMYLYAKDKMQIRVDSKGKLFGVFPIKSKISLVCSRILKEEENLDYVVAFNTWGGLSGKLSFRSKNGFNCNDLGVANGHDAAAGGSISIEDSFMFLEKENLAFTYNDKYDPEDPKSAFEEVEL
jgi:oligoribonuclease NrnB/cAMP/cGMP phosphodiesterase (DHH superfamily)